MSVPFEYGVGYVPIDSDTDPNRFFFSPGFSGFPSGSIKAQAVYGTFTVPLEGYFDAITDFVVTAGNFQGTPNLVTFYVLFTISYVSATQTSITFAWSGLPQPSNDLYLELNNGDLEYSVGSDQPASGTYTATGLLAGSTYQNCLFQDPPLTNFITNLIDASTLPNRWQLVQTLTPSHVAISSALSADGSTIISGSGVLGDSFPACIFRIIGGQFQEVTTIPPSSEGFFGEEVAVDARGQVFGISCTNGNIIPTEDHISGLDSKLVTFDLTSSVDVQGNVVVSGTISGNFPVRTNQSGSTIDVLASDYYVGVNGTGITINLPVSPITGKQYVIKDESGTAYTNHITLSGNGHTIDGSATLTMAANYISIQVIWTGSFWSVI
jgi:hypothetical protein